MVTKSFLLWALLCCLLFCAPASFAASNGGVVNHALGQDVNSKEYVLGVGDRIKMVVYGENDLSGEYEVGSTGYAALPLIGDIRAAGPDCF